MYDESVGLVFDGISEDEDDEGPPAKPAPAPVQKKPPARAAPAKATPKQSLKITTAKATPQTGKAPDKGAIAPATNGPSKSTTGPVNATPIASTSARPMPSTSAQPVASTSAGPAQRPKPQASTSAQPGAQPKQVNVHPVKILVGPIPPTYKPPAPQPTNTATDEVAAQLLKDPPIVLHEGTLILAPAIFGQMKPEQITQLSRLGATKALSILQSYIVQHVSDYCGSSSFSLICQYSSKKSSNEARKPLLLLFAHQTCKPSLLRLQPRESWTRVQQANNLQRKQPCKLTHSFYIHNRCSCIVLLKRSGGCHRIVTSSSLCHPQRIRIKDYVFRYSCMKLFVQCPTLMRQSCFSLYGFCKGHS